MLALFNGYKFLKLAQSLGVTFCFHKWLHQELSDTDQREWWREWEK